MTPSVKYLKEAKFKEPMVVIPLRQYEALIEHMEDLEDSFAVRERADEKNIPWAQVKKDIKKKLSKK